MKNSYKHLFQLLYSLLLSSSKSSFGKINYKFFTEIFFKAKMSLNIDYSHMLSSLVI